MNLTSRIANYEFENPLMNASGVMCYDEMELEQISGGGVKINVQNGVTNFDESYFSGDIYSDDLLFPFFSEKRTILLKE